MKLEEIKLIPVLLSDSRYSLMAKVRYGRYVAKAIAPLGNSTSSYEKKVSRNFKRYKKKLDELVGVELLNIDEFLKDFPGDISTAISMAVKRLIAKTKKIELFMLWGNKKMPIPFLNILNGGVHAGNKLSFQEYMIVPFEKTFFKSIKTAVKIYHDLKNVLRKKYGPSAINVGLEGGFAPPLKKVKEPLKIIKKIIDGLGAKTKLAIDCAASQFYKDGYYFVDGKKYSKDKLLKLYLDLADEFDLFSIEDPFYENDFDAFENLKNSFKGWVVGDDIFASQKERILKGKDSCNTLLLKINQVGTVDQAVESFKTAKKLGWNVIVSHRSGDSCDNFIADFAVGIGADAIKSGAPARGERISKYNRLIEIENSTFNYS